MGAFILDKFVVSKSGRLSGKVRVSGSKNAALPILAAALLVEDEVTLEDVPRLNDIEIMKQLLEVLNVEVDFYNRNGVRINTREIQNAEISYELTSKMRASTLILGPILARFGSAKISLPGGCSIGTRPIDLHIKGLRAMGAEIETHNGMIDAVADRLVGAKIYLDFPSVGATENIMMAAVLAEGETVIDNAAMEPEIVDLSNFLNKMGADVRGAGTSTIRVKGVQKLHSCSHQIIPDRIEAGTFMVAAAMTKGDVTIENVITSHIKPVIAKLEEMGCDVEEDGAVVRVIGPENPKSTHVKTLPHPGFPTDMQPQFMAYMSIIEGTSLVFETIFENRFRHVEELRRMGADITIDGRTAAVRGLPKLTGCSVKATDLRAGAALILAGFVAEGETVVTEISHIDRGYENIEEKFRSIGGNIRRISE